MKEGTVANAKAHTFTLSRTLDEPIRIVHTHYKMHLTTSAGRAFAFSQRPRR
jgi:hypothetical protein